MPFIITVSDASNRTGAVFERAKQTISERPLTNRWVAACNAPQGVKIGGSRLDQILSGTEITSVSNLKKIMAHPDVLMACNIYSVIFDFPHNQLFIASGEIPAALEPFRMLRLFE
jgi:hypothetical protein